jgi:hypothetical protein
MFLEKLYLYRLYYLGWQNLIIHPSRVPTKLVPSTFYLLIKLSLAGKNYIKKTQEMAGNGGGKLLVLKLGGDV